MDRSISSLYKECRRLLDTLVNASPQQLQRASLTNAKVYDELDRFKIWGGNLGAGHAASTKISLDWRLRDASELKEEIIQLLEESVDALENLHEIVSGNREDQSVVIEAEDDEQDEAASVSEATELFGVVSDSAASLFRLALIIQKATPRDRFIRASINVQEPFDPMYDMQHVRAKFPKLDHRDNIWLQRKLATAITQRRQFFRYSRDHHERKSTVKSEPPTVARPKIDRPNQLQADMLSVGPKSLAQTQASTLLLDHLEVARFNVDEFDDSLSQTSFATSVNENDINRLRVPKLEEVSKKLREFECPYCYTIIAPRNQRQWKKHVFEDLRPYLCTSQDCDVKLFSDRRAWFDHELSKHRCWYKCLFCRFHSFHSEHELQKHVSKHHGETIASSNLGELLEAAREAPHRFAAAECPFCDEWARHLRALNPHISSEDVTFVTSKQFRSHLATHMEQLALFALPRLQEDDGSFHSGSVFAGRTQLSEDSAHEKDQAQPLEQTFGLVHDDYTVALISSIGLVDELALRMLNKQHSNLPVSSSDPNHYSLGQIGHHNVVLVTPKDRAGDDNVLSMTNLLQTFPKLRFGFSVETGSGIPTKPNEDPQLDLHLGDVVVNHQNSTDEESSDELKTTGIGSTLKATLPLAVRYALRSIPSQIENEGLRIRLFLDPILANGSMEKEKYSYPGEAWDQLFASSYIQSRNDQKPQDSQIALSEIEEMNFDVQRFRPGQKIFPPCDGCRAIQTECMMSTGRCMQCEKDKIVCTWQKVSSEDLIARNTREDSSIPVVHIGKIIRANVLTPGGESIPIPDQSGSILCVEKDPKYLSTALPCLTVRGIADYGFDQPYFKGIDWQGYAIGVATAYAIHILDWIQEPLDHRDSEWLPQKQRISELYQSGHSIPDIQDKMRKLYDFDATSFQYQRKIAAWKLIRPNTAEHKYVNQQDQLAEPAHDVEETQAYSANFTIKCICMVPEDDGHTILCNGCNTWQHADCYDKLGNISEDHESHYCVDCQPRYYDEFGRQIIFNNNVRPGRWREHEHQHQHQPELSYETQRALEELERLKKEKDHEELVARMEKALRLEEAKAHEDEENRKGQVRSESPPELSDETRRALEELERLRKEKDHEELVARIENDFRLKEAKAHEDEENRRAHEKKMKEQAIEEWKAAEEGKKKEAKEKEEEKERIGKEYMRQQLRKDGYSEEEIENLMTKSEKKKKKRDHSPAVIAERPTYLKVHKNHIAPETLNVYKINWEWADADHIYIKETISEEDQEILFEHTEKLRQKGHTEKQRGKKHIGGGKKK